MTLTEDRQRVLFQQTVLASLKWAKGTIVWIDIATIVG
jgi:hypothetical protein